MRQSNSALSNLSLNIQGHEEVPKSKFFFKSCPSAVISLYMSNKGISKLIKRRQNE